MGHKAVWIAYVIPLFIMMAVLLGLTSSGMEELYAGLLAIASVALYYLLVWIFRDRLRNEYVFNIKQI
ncbi:MAG: SoxR reducing system RseC family protein, partial [Bacteroidales bacterium]|nr:SoxR reducing system RseC family protein [Candidatus Cryptobacteroides equifaecalis]